jgi:hypothetical protein
LLSVNALYTEAITIDSEYPDNGISDDSEGIKPMAIS